MSPLQVGATISFVMFAVSVLLAAYTWLITESTPDALLVLQRVTLVGVALALSSTISRWLLEDKARPTSKRDWGSLGFLVGLLVTGIVSEPITASPTPTLEEAKNPTALGQAVSLKGPTISGSQFDLAEYRGKVVLIDFWATWCGPCLVELPSLKKAYERYHSKGLEVVSVSLDYERAELEDFLKADPLPWPQIFFEEETNRGFESPVARQFGIELIPNLLLIDAEGNLVERGLSGRRISSAVARALGEPQAWADVVTDGLLRVLRWTALSILESHWWLLIGLTMLGTLVATGLQRLARRRIPSQA